MTGRIPSQHGIHDWIKSGNIDVEDNVTWSGADRPINYLHGQTAFTDILAQNGYTCGLSGKWHLGDSATAQKSHTFFHLTVAEPFHEGNKGTMRTFPRSQDCEHSSMISKIKYLDFFNFFLKA